jgi:hypothetical protein
LQAPASHPPRTTRDLFPNEIGLMHTGVPQAGLFAILESEE